MPAKVKGVVVEDKAAEKAPAREVPQGAFEAELAEWAGKKFEAAEQTTAEAIARALDTAAYAVSKIEQKDRSEKAPPPFTTSTLQQQANIRLHFTGDRTMRAAQKLYEGVDLSGEGSVALITYMRTDSTRVSNEALQAVRGYIGSHFGPPYLPEKPNYFASGKSAQEAHEAIRPTDTAYTPERVDRLLSQSTPHRHDLIRLYTLIYNRFVASQMTPAIFAVTNVEITASVPAPSASEGTPSTGLFKAQGKVLKFDGYRKVLAPGGRQDDATLPALAEKQPLDRLGLTASQHFTQPPPRYNEASLIKALEKEGIGRPSTYASIIHKITSEERRYIEVKERRFHATEIGKAVTDLLVEHFPRVMDLKFTSHMEEELDQIEDRKAEYRQVLDGVLGAVLDGAAGSRDEDAEQPRPGDGRDVPAVRQAAGAQLQQEDAALLHRLFRLQGGLQVHQAGRGRGAAAGAGRDGIQVSDLRQADAATHGQDGAVPRLQRLPRMQDDDELRRRGQAGAVGQADGVHLREVRQADGDPRGPARAVSGLHRISEVQERQGRGRQRQPGAADRHGLKCEKCGSPMTVKKGPRGPFLGCTGYPKCRNAKPMPPELKEQLKDQLPAPPPKKELPKVEVTDTCPECGGPMKLRESKRGGATYFLGCAKFPRCKGTREASPELLDQLQEAGAPF